MWRCVACLVYIWSPGSSEEEEKDGYEADDDRPSFHIEDVDDNGMYGAQHQVNCSTVAIGTPSGFEC